MTAAVRVWQDECMRLGIDPAADGFVLADRDEAPRMRHLNAIVPVSFACVGDRTVASAYPVIRSEVSPFFERYCSPDALFTSDAFAALDRMLRPYLAQWGYKPAMFPSRYGVSLVQDSAADVPSSAILCGTVRMTEDASARNNHTSMRSADCILRGAYAHIVHGEIVCIASVNRVSGAQHCVEIGVECAPEYRRRGYASSCVCALTRDLCADGKTVLYRHYHTNTGSAAVAKAAGFRAVGRFFSYTSFAI